MVSVLITGASSGIGLASAVELATRGETVFASMRNLERSGALRAALAAAGATAHVLQLDVTDPESIDRAIEEVVNSEGGADVLVNNAGIASLGPLEFTEEEEFRRILDTNLLGAFRMTRAVLPSMRARGSGRIVNVSSAAAHPRFGIRLWGPYAISKAALHAFSLELVKEVAPLGIDVVVLEGGVGGRTEVWNEIASRAEAMRGSTGPYALAERLAVAQVDAALAVPDRLGDVAKMVADACTAPRPGTRFPSGAQAIIDSSDTLSDERYEMLAQGQTDPAIYEGSVGFWQLQRALLSGLSPDG